MKYVLILIVLGVAGCTTSRVTPVGSETYMVSSVGAGFSTAPVRDRVFRKANEYCEGKGLVMVPTSFNATQGQLGSNPPEATLTFMALKPGDPEIKKRRFSDLGSIQVQ